MNETNRTAIVLAAAFWIILMAVVIFLTWSADDKVIDKLADFAEYLQANVQGDTAGRLIVTLGALAIVTLGLLVIVIELAPEDEERELRVEQAGSTTIVPAQALRLRLEEGLMALPEVTAAKARVFTREKGIASNLDITIAQGANIASVTQESSRIVVDTIQTELGLPVSGLPTVRIGFGGAKLQAVASSVVRSPEPAMDTAAMMGSVDDAAPSEPAVMDPLEGIDLAEPAPADTPVEGTGSAEPTPADTPVEGQREEETPGW
jgi:hypothetical protein